MANRARHDRELAATAIDKMRRGEPLSRREKTALQRVQNEQRDKIMEELIKEFPKTRYAQLAGRNTRHLHDQARRYGVPVNTQKIDLERVIRWVHDMLADRGQRLFVTGEDEDPLLAGGNSPALEKCRHEKWLLLQMERKQKERELIPVRLLSECHNEVASILRSCGEALERIFGIDAGDLLRESLDAAERRVSDLLSNYEKSTRENGDAREAAAGSDQAAADEAVRAESRQKEPKED